MQITTITVEDHQAIALLLKFLQRQGHDSDAVLLRKLITQHDLAVKTLYDLHNTHRHKFAEAIDNACDELFKAMSIREMAK